MKYFRIQQADQLCRPLAVIGLDGKYYPYNISKQAFEKIPEFIVAYFKNDEHLEVSAILNSPTMLISDKVKKVFDLYNDEIAYKGVQLFSKRMEDKLGYLYWVMSCEERECLHNDCVMLPNGTVEEIILDQSLLEDEPDIIKVSGVPQNIVLVSLAVAESLLRRNLFGIRFDEVTIK